MKKILNKENLFVLIFTLVALHPVVELDYLLVDYLGSIPRLTTIINYIVFPFLVVLVFLFYEKNKKRALLLFGVYALIFGGYFIVHCKNANVIATSIHLTENFYFNISDEVVYTMTLLLPLVYVYVFNLSNINQKILKKIVITISLTTALPIFISNLFTFGMSTYQGYTIDNFLSWFKNPMTRYWHHPRKYATKFFFEEGNTIGILMIMCLPFMYYFWLKEKSRIKKVFEALLIIIHSLAMIILSTRLATYCSVVVPCTLLVIYVILLILKYEHNLNKLYICFLAIMTIICACIIPYSPAYQNQQIASQDYGIIYLEEHQREDGQSVIADGKDLEKWSNDWWWFYYTAFKAYRFLMNVTPPVYYTEWYSYEYDPEFWVDLIFDYELEERINGRQIETIFTKYKWDDLTTNQKLTGFGYGTFMRGGILIERDFVQQYYSYGLIGEILIFGIWVVLALYAGIKLLLGFRSGKWNYLNIILIMTVGIGFVCSYISGHTLDQLDTSIFISLCLAFLIKNLNTKEEIHE